MTLPKDALEAVTHTDPALFYQQLATQPFQYSPLLGCWLATSPGDVTVVMDDPRCRVRPLAEPVPAALLDSQAGEIFSLLVRMTDGKQHHQMKDALTATLRRFSEDAIRHQGQIAAQSLVAVQPVQFAYQMPMRTTALLLGIPLHALDQLGHLMEKFAACLTPGSSQEQINVGKEVAPTLWQVMQEHLSEQFAPTLSQDLRIANAIGLLWQGYDSTASLILHGFLALQHQPQPEDWSHFLMELVRQVSPIQNTRRFMAEDGVLLDQQVKGKDVILIVLAAANRAITGVGASFGHGIHRCPGQRLAFLITEMALSSFQSKDMRVFHAVGFKSSLNARIPLLEEQQ